MTSEFEPLDLIGRGSFGQIRKVRRISDGKILARKEISYKTMNQKEKTQLIAEFRILKSLVHPNIVQYYHHEHVAEEHAVHLYMEYCGGGDLAGVIRACKKTGEYVPESMVWSVFTQMTLALFRCHYNSDPPPPGELFNSGDNFNPPQPATVILHRDIKPDNVFLDQFNSVKLGDFGLAKILDQEHFMANTYVGTPYYMSPEVLLDKPFTPQSDIWSLGCVIYELCAKHPPFQAKTHLQLSQKIREGIYPSLPSVYSATLSKTIAACLNMNYLQRPTTSTLLRLDVMKLCRKEREAEEAKRNIQELQNQLLAERESTMKQLQIQQEQQQAQMLNQLTDEFKVQLEQEVERRVAAILQEQSMNTQNQNRNSRSPALSSTGEWQAPRDSNTVYKNPTDFSSITSSPTDVIMTSAQNTPVPYARNVKGPRTIHDNPGSPILSRSPLKTLYFEEIESPSSKYSTQRKRVLQPKRQSFDNTNDSSTVTIKKKMPGSKPEYKPNNLVNHLSDYQYSLQNKSSSEVSASSSIASTSTFSSQSSQFSSASSEGSHGSCELDHHFGPLKYSSTPIATTPKDSPSSPIIAPRERQAPHFQAMYANKNPVNSSAGTAAVFSKVIGIKGGPAGAMRQRIVQGDMNYNSQHQNPIWDENIHGDDMPSPFLKRRERNRH